MDLTLQCGLSPAATQRLPARSGQNQRHRRHGLTIVSGRHTACSPSAQPSRLGLELSSCRRPSRSICLSRARRSGRARAGAAVQATAQGLAAPSPELAAGAVLVLAASLAVRKLILMKQKRPRVVIIGGSFAGLQAASDLRAHAEVYLIDPRSYFEYTPGVLRALVQGSLRDRQLPLQGVVKVGSFLHAPGATFRLNGTALEITAPGIAAEARSKGAPLSGLQQDDCVSLPFDFLILSSGSTYPAPFKPTADEPDVESRRRAFETARDALRAARSVKIAGAGVVGVELAAELATHNADGKAIRLSDPLGLLTTLTPKAAGYCERFLRRRGVEISLGAANEAPGAAPPGPGVEYKCFGVRARSDVFSGEAIAAARTPQGYLQRDPRLRLRGTGNVFVLGDVAEKSPDERLASFAHWEAEYAVAQIRAMWRKGAASAGAPFPPYTPPPKLVNVSLGPWDGVFTYDDRVLATGIAAALIKAITEFWFVRLLPIPYAVLRLLPRLGPAKLGGIPAGATAAA